LEICNCERQCPITGYWHVETWVVAEASFLEAGISGSNEISHEQIERVVERILNLGEVPLVHANEWGFSNSEEKGEDLDP
jgi:hypothetical protein